MGKPRRRHLVATSATKNSAASDLDLHGEDSWVVVKKQRITILIPPLPHARKPIMPKPGPSKLEAIPMKTVNNRSPVQIEGCTRIPSVDEQEKVTPLAPNRGIQIPSLPHFSTLPKLPIQNVTVESRNTDHAKTFKSHNMLRVSNISQTMKRPRLLHGPGSFLDGSMLLNQRLRASLLEKKLQKAGGLSRWLASLGLGQFVRIFEGKSVNKFQLVNLNMKKLKDMGADAVGPRRKLMHAIDCICQPYCFEAR